VERINGVNLQLLCDVDVRWSSTLLMIERAVFLREVCIGCFKFIHVFDFVQAIENLLENNEFEELRNKFPLDEMDWEALETYQEILQVNMPHHDALLFILITFQIPHAFQHLLSKEKTPTLSHVIPAFGDD
jgi:hypothetical protein